MVECLQTNIVEFKDIYEDYLKKICYESPKDIKINALQTALLLLKVDKDNLNKIKLGYWCPITEKCFDMFRSDKHIKKSVGIDKKTWTSLFEEVEKKCNIKMLYSKNSNSIILENVDKYYENQKEIENIDNRMFFTNDNVYNINSGKTIEYPQRHLINYGEDWSNYIPPQLTTKGNKTIGVSDRAFSNYGKYFLNQDINPNNTGGSFFGVVNHEMIDSVGKEHMDGPSYTISSSGIEFGDKYLDHNGMQDVDLDYDFAYNLLANSIYSGNQDVKNHEKWYSYLDDDGEIKVVNLKESNKNEAFFNNKKSEMFKRRNFDISIKYGVANSDIIKIIKNIIPRNITQEVNASGEPIFEVVEFIAQDVLEEVNKN